MNVVCFVKSERCIPVPNIFLWVAAFVADGAAVNPNGVKALLANGLSTLPIKGNAAFCNVHKSLPRYPTDCPIYAIGFLIIL